ncbi:sulfatase family protein [Chondrinema litorale]|uniref:sulfatase family protein n=1 Tax=Chondrinema litorale TaxID=2994555 RepID=UPI0025435640|nr:sulfatase [Chondrinema litorale]UZR95037.1 sulfatase [Chondrinema litorale]
MKVFKLSMLLCIINFFYEANAQNHPNILVFIADDAGWRDFGCYRNTAIKTKHIDELAANGIRFNNVFLTSPQCSPSRTSLLTGQFPHTLRTEDLHTPLADSIKILPHYLKQKGYYTGLIQKAHLGPDAIKQFDYFDYATPAKQIDEFKAFLDKSEKKPFFMWYAFSDPHRDYQENTIPIPHKPEKVVVPPYLADTPLTRKDIALYYDEIARMDQNIGLAVEELERRGVLENTLIIFLSDNGSPFTRAKGTLYDAGIKTPFIIYWKGTISPSQTNDQLYSVINLAPTLLDVAGISPSKSIFGKSMLPLIKGDEMQSDQYIFSERNWHDCDEHIRSVRSDTFKLIKNAYIEWPHGTAADLASSLSHQELVRLKQEGKLNPEQLLIFQSPRPTIELYNVIEDPEEFHNLASDRKYRKIIQQLHEELYNWMKQTDDFHPSKRRRMDGTDRVTGALFHHQSLPPLYEDW